MPEITAIPLYLRGAIASFLWTAMVALMALGYSTQPFWVDFIDCFVAGILTAGLLAQWHGNTDFADEDDNRPPLQRSEKMSWFIRYTILTVVLVGLTAYQIQHLPTVQ